VARPRGVVPTLRLADLSDAEFRFLTERVLQAPALWAFACVAGEVGLDAAIEYTRSRNLPLALSAKLTRVGYTVASLPSYPDIVALVFASRLAHRAEFLSSEGREPESMREMGEKFGADRHIVRHALRILRTYIPKRWNTDPARRVRDGRKPRPGVEALDVTLESSDEASRTIGGSPDTEGAGTLSSEGTHPVEEAE